MPFTSAEESRAEATRTIREGFEELAEQHKMTRAQFLRSVLFPEEEQQQSQQSQQSELDPLNQAYLDLADAHRRIEEIEKQRNIDKFLASLK